MQNIVQNIDALELLRSLPDDSVDLVFTDPPYNISKKKRILRRTYKSGKNGDVSLDFGEWDYNFDPIPFLEETKRVLTSDGNVLIFCSQELIGVYNDWLHKELHFKNLLIWCKSNPIPNFVKSSYVSSTEYIIWGTKSKTIRGSKNFTFSNQRDMKNWFTYPVCAGKERIRDPETHPSQKPLALCERLLLTHSAEGSLVVDPFAGYGTIPLAAVRNNRNFLATDLNQTYVAVANKRIHDFGYCLERKPTEIVDDTTEARRVDY